MPVPHLAAFLDHAVRKFEPDPRALAIWLEGSLASGEGDAGSDIDLHLCVADEEFEGFTGDVDGLLSRLGPVISYIVVPVPSAALLPATIASAWGPVRIDLMVESRSSVSTRPRRHDVGARFLVDRGGVEEARTAAPSATFNAPSYLRGIMRTFFFGAMWPWRMTQRRDWSALLWNDVTVVQQFIVPAMLIADGSPEFHREMTTRSRFLTQPRREEVEQFQRQLIAAFAGADATGPDRDILAALHLRMFDLVCRSFREACEGTGVEYPADAEAHYVAFLDRQFGGASRS